MEEKNGKCFFCNETCFKYERPEDMTMYQCENCGNYDIDDYYFGKIDINIYAPFLFHNYKIYPPKGKYSCFFSSEEEAIKIEEIKKKDIKKFPNLIVVHEKEIKAWFPIEFNDKINTILLGLQKLTKYEGETISLTDEQIKNLLLIQRYLKNTKILNENCNEQISYFCDYLSKQNLVECKNNSFKILPEGWKLIDELRKIQLNGKQALTPMPNVREEVNDCQIPSNDYKNIMRIIYDSCSSMEKSAVTFSKHKEEELRDIILTNLNSHKEYLATSETFSKVGKTDIHILFENNAAYIAECKVWHGEKNLEEAIGQLFSYTTWKDVKTSLIIFNKDNKDFNKLLVTIKNYLSKNTMCLNINTLKPNEWLCEFSKDYESTSKILVHIVIFNLCI